MYASTLLSVAMAFLGQTDITEQSNGLPAQPVQIAPDDGPAFYGGQLDPSQLPKQPTAGGSIYGGSQTTISDQPQTTGSVYGGSNAIDSPVGDSPSSVYGGRSIDQPAGIEFSPKSAIDSQPILDASQGKQTDASIGSSSRNGLPSDIDSSSPGTSSLGTTPSGNGFTFSGNTAVGQPARTESTFGRPTESQSPDPRTAQGQPAFRDFSNGSTSLSDQPATPAFGGGQGFKQYESSSARAAVGATSNIARTSSETPLTPVHTGDSRAAHRLLAQSLQTPAGEGIKGKPVTLEQAIAKTTTPIGRKQAIADYWDLAVAIREYYLAIQETRFLVGLPLPQSPHQKAVLNAAQSVAAAGERKAQLAAINAQHELAESASLPSTELPLPADAPFIGAYRTYFDMLRKRDAVPERLRRIDDTLPVVLQLVDARAEAIVASEQAVDELYQAYSVGQVSLPRLLEAHNQLHSQRRQFLASVGKYNQQIAEYAVTVAGNRLTSQRIVGMLIETSPAANSVLADRNRGGDIRRVSNVESAINPTPRNVFQR